MKNIMEIMPRRLLVFAQQLSIAAIILVLLTGCGKQKQEGADVSDETGSAMVGDALAERGKGIFSDPDFSPNEIACADCHADFDESIGESDRTGGSDGTGAGERIRAGHSILGAASRSETWNGEFSGDALRRTAAGAAKCASIYQGRGEELETALLPDEADALMAFFAYISTGDEAPRLGWDVVTWPGDPEFDIDAFKLELEAIDDLRGNAGRGEKMFERACSYCHGTGLGPSPKMLRRKAKHVARNVRAGEEAMPFFSRDKLSDQEVADIKAWLGG